ncbi:MAG TPA: N-acetylmuramoyl-L-alanine amidase [Candidatus Dietzia merdigallinarum]|nr:N-acetylmuramoyl-L-alanine amidase [Candidatus Dietzia merdigallinarum]
MHYSGRRRTLAVAAVVAASVVTPLAVYGADQMVESGDDITTTANTGLPTGEVSVSLAEAPTAAGVNRDIAGGQAPVKEVSSETPFSMMGVTWKGFNPQAMANVRAQNPDGSWGPWFEAESVDGKGESTTGTGGTEPIYLGLDTTKVQIALNGVDVEDSSLADAPDADVEAPDSGPDAADSTTDADAGADSADAPADEDIASRADESADEDAGEDAAPAAPTSAPAAPASAPSTPAFDSAPPVPTRFADIKPVAETSDLETTDVKAVLLSPDKTPTPDPEAYADVTARGGTGAQGDIAAKQPSIISRSGWGANESIRCRNATYDSSLAAGTVHHTAGSNNYSREGAASVVRGIYSYHASNLGWCDVGYNVMVDKYGQAFEGRHGGLSRNVQGAHAGGFNGNTWGISMIGDYTSLTPPDVTVRKVGEILGWRLAVAGVDPKGTDTHYSEGTSYTKYSYGTSVRLPNIFAHRDVGLTSCPGNAGYAKMGEIRDIAARYAKGGGGGGGGNSSPSPTGDNGGGTGGGTGGSMSKANVQEAVTTALRTVLNGGRIDVQGLTRTLTSGMTLSDIPLGGGSVEDLAGGDFAKLAAQLSGPLGKVLSGIQKFGNVSLVKAENGALYSSPETGTHPVWGVIGDAWAAQGFEHGPLGLPVSSEAEREDGTVAQRFVGGTLVYDPATKELSVEPNP